LEVFAMTALVWLLIGLTTAAIGIIALGLRPMSRLLRERRFNRARQAFRLCRERLEAKFVELASSSGRPRGLRWMDCEFQDEVTFARERRSGDLCALVGVTIAFEAIEGGGMEEVEAVDDLKAASSLFIFHRGDWKTEGRVIFNLAPREAVRHFGEEIELVEPTTGVPHAPTPRRQRL
jgi:hypothetical protein